MTFVPPHHEPVVLQGPSLCTNSSPCTHVPQPRPRNTTCFQSREICLLPSLPIQPKAMVQPRTSLPIGAGHTVAGSPPPPPRSHLTRLAPSSSATFLTMSHPELRREFQPKSQTKQAKPFIQATQGPRIKSPSRSYPTRIMAWLRCH